MSEEFGKLELSWDARGVVFGVMGRCVIGSCIREKECVSLCVCVRERDRLLCLRERDHLARPRGTQRGRETTNRRHLVRDSVFRV